MLYGDKGENNNDHYGENNNEKGYDLFVFALDSAAKTIENADVIKDFQDDVDKIAGLGLIFNQIKADKGSGNYINDTILKVGNEYLAIIEGFQFTGFTEEDFTPVSLSDIA